MVRIFLLFPNKIFPEELFSKISIILGFKEFFLFNRFLRYFAKDWRRILQKKIKGLESKKNVGKDFGELDLEKQAPDEHSSETKIKVDSPLLSVENFKKKN